MRAAAYVTSIVMLSLAFVTGSNAQTQPATRPTLWLIGDSTVKVGTAGQMGWGEQIAQFFDTGKLRIENRAIGGRSSRTFQTEGRWDKVLAELQPGDFVMMQFGHNDPAPLAGDNRERGTIRGLGEETEEVTLTLGDNKGKHEVVHTYGWYMRKYVADAKAKGATPIVISYIPRCPRPGEKVEVPKEETSYALWAHETAKAAGVPFLDLNRRIWQTWVDRGMTQEQIKKELFTEGADFTHTGPPGAKFNAERVVEGVKELDLSLKSYLKE